MNMYAYCGNNPANFIDPSGLKEVLVAFYDPDEKMKDGKTPMFEETVNDFSGEDDYAVAMKSTKDVLDWLRDNVEKILEPGDKLEIFFYDHAGGSGTVDYDTYAGGLWFGDEFIKTDVELNRPDKFWKDLAEVLPADATLHFRQCWVGWDAEEYMAGKKRRSTLADLAYWTQRTVTGTPGDVYYLSTGETRD
jgi:hypothetical protein